MTTSTAIAAPTGEPTERRRFQLTNLDGNNNKFYLVETWAMPDDQLFFRATYGRVGANPQIDEKLTSAAWVERKIREKLAKGYVEVTLHRPTVVATAAVPTLTLEPKLQQLVDYIYAEAGDKIASYLAVGVDALSPDQIDRGRKLLTLAQQQHGDWQQQQSQASFQLLAGTVQQYYNAVPTQLPARIERQQVVEDFCKAFDEQEDRLNQLEAAIATLAVQRTNPQVSRYETLGAELALLPQNATAYGEIMDYIERTMVHGYKVQVRDIFTVQVPDERHDYEQNKIGTNNKQLLFHGTAGHNVRHIMRTGLICPRTPSNGRMFGHGIYFANKATKSTNYCSSSTRRAPHFLFLAEVAVGRQYVAKDAMPDQRKAPMLHDSVWGKAGHTGAWAGKLQFDEFIIYNNAQQTLKYLVTFDR
ncbi:MAG: WGR domain-containing protein [Chloroflexaceae bacterium]|jgi:poly [ADP-ribose] polymerase|nr:WGR domain-containing protein [Chloroflexaceae bacterium]